ncbi:MAG: EthD family reductase, partial [Gammaproteobacteria bacterium]|nr:EthD family reductase [Deltaproteobacteria bacterium]NIW10524.1 EthD family reductase [Gammaproteobacteria bacterium]
CNKHIPMVQEKLGNACKDAAIYEGLGGGEPGSPAPYVAMVHLSFDSIEAFQTAYAPHAETIMADVPNY